MARRGHPFVGRVGRACVRPEEDDSMTLESTKFPRSLRGPGVQFLSLLLATGGFMLVGLIRQKLAVTDYGAETLAAFSQANVFQNVWQILVGGGLVVAARMVLSDGERGLFERSQAGSWLLRWPLLVGLVALPLGFLLSPSISSALTGSQRWSLTFVLAAAGIPVQMAVTNSLSVIQVLGRSREFLLASGLGTLAAGVSVVVLMHSGNLVWAFSTYVVVPGVTLVCLVVCSPTLRTTVQLSPRLRRVDLRRLGRITGSTAVNGLVAALVTAVLSARLAHTYGLVEVAILQPVVVVTMAASLVTASLTIILMLDINRQELRKRDLFRSGAWHQAIPLSLIFGVVAVGSTPLMPLAIRLVLDESLAGSSNIASVQVGAEVLTCVVWLAAAVLVPLNRLTVWVVSTVIGYVLRLVVGIALMPATGAGAVPIGSFAQALFTVALLLLILRPRLRWSELLQLLLLALAGLSTTLVWWRYPTLSWPSWGLSMCLLVAGLGLEWMRRRAVPHRPVARLPTKDRE